MATLTARAKLRGVPYEGVPVGTIKRHAAGKCNFDKDAMIAAARARRFGETERRICGGVDVSSKLGHWQPLHQADQRP